MAISNWLKSNIDSGSKLMSDAAGAVSQKAETSEYLD